MENWLIETVKILAGAILGVLLTEAFPTIKSFFKRSSLSLRKRSIEYIKDEYERIKAYKANHATLAVELLRLLSNRLVFVTIFITFAIVGIYTKVEGRNTWMVENIGIIMGVFLGTLYSDYRDIQRLIEKVAYFEKYRERTINSLAKLGATLDEEEETKK